MNPVRDHTVGIEHKDYKNTYVFKNRATGGLLTETIEHVVFDKKLSLTILRLGIMRYADVSYL